MNCKEKLEEAKRLYKSANDDQKYVIESLFPELKESKDEKIRKKLFSAFKGIMDDADKDELWYGLTYNDILAWLEKQDKQKTADEVKPKKFKVGDWVIGGATWNKPRQIAEIRKDGYITTYPGWIGSSFEDDMHLWTIQDAKDGDVLVASDGSIFLFAGVIDCACKYYVALTADNNVKINKETKGGYWETSRAVHPATKEQRERFFAAMHDAGYEWDAERKKLSKRVIDEGKSEIDYCFTKMMNGEKVSPTWSEEDERAYKSIIYSFNHNYPLTIQQQEFVKSLRPQPKQEWSKEDESTIKDIIEDLEYAERKGYVLKNNTFLKEVHWLKSLKDRV